MLSIVQISQEMRCPGDGIGFAGTGGMLDQILLPGALGQHRRQQLARGIELVIARENDLLDLLPAIALGHDIAADNLQPAIARPHLLPQVGGAMPVGIHRIARRTVIAAIERQKSRRYAQQARGHQRRAVAQREMHQRPTRKIQQRLGGRLPFGFGVTVEAVLIHRIFHRLGEI